MTWRKPLLEPAGQVWRLKSRKIKSREKEKKKKIGQGRSRKEN